MAIAVPFLFALATLAAAFVIVHSLRAALPAIRTLRSEFAHGAESELIIATLETREPAPAFTPAVRHRGSRPKAVTHRLHQFPRATQAA